MTWHGIACHCIAWSNCITYTTYRTVHTIHTGHTVHTYSTCIYIYVHIYIHVLYVNIYMYIYIYVYIYIYAYIYMCIYIYVYIYIYVCVYLHAHIICAHNIHMYTLYTKKSIKKESFFCGSGTNPSRVDLFISWLWVHLGSFYSYRYPQILRIVHETNHPASAGPSWLWKPPYLPNAVARNLCLLGYLGCLRKWSWKSRKVRAKRITTQRELATVTVESRFSQVSFVGLEVLDIL